jgi:hypothetical protein
MINEVTTERFKNEFAAASTEERARIREWVLTAFDDGGMRRSIEERVDERPFVLEDFARTNLRLDRGIWLPSGPPTGSALKCVYAIASERDWLYVGYTSNVRFRRTRHAASLRTGHHHNRLLQRHWSDDAGEIWFLILEPIYEGLPRNRRGVQHHLELVWKRRLRPLYDREPRRADISFFLEPTGWLQN